MKVFMPCFPKGLQHFIRLTYSIIAIVSAAALSGAAEHCWLEWHLTLLGEDYSETKVPKSSFDWAKYQQNGL